jgi:oligoendopeptidase F
LNMQLNVIRHALFRQTMLAEFEQLAHEAVEHGESLTADRSDILFCGHYTFMIQ